MVNDSRDSIFKPKFGNSVYANYIGPSIMTDANSEGFPVCDERITDENDWCVIKIIGIHWKLFISSLEVLMWLKLSNTTIILRKQTKNL